jgi:hypothetical protein
MPRVVRKLLVVLVAAAVAAAAFTPGRAEARECGLPDSTPMWVDFVDSPFWQVFARPGVVAAVADAILPAKLRAAGVPTVRLDLYLKKRVGTPTAPLDPATVVANANRLLDYTVTNTACATPTLVENELFGAKLATPWSESYQRYRDNVLLFLRTLAARGAHPVLLLNSNPFVASPVAAQWWRDVAAVADIVREDYVPANIAYRLGPARGNRAIRQAYRRGIDSLTGLGIPSTKLGIMISFSTHVGYGGRNGLEPAVAWYRVAKWYALSARSVAKELGLGHIWSWGWQWWSEAERDPDKARAACVWLWARNPGLCDGTRAAGKGFVASRTEGQLRLPASVECRIGRNAITDNAIRQLLRVTGDRSVAASAILARLVMSHAAPIGRGRLAAAERAVIAQRFSGSRSSYAAALGRVHATPAVARAILADQLRRAQIEGRLRGRRPTGAAARAFYAAYPEVLVRRVRATPGPLWLDGRTEGLALSSLAPPRVFSLAAGRPTLIRTILGSVRVAALGSPFSLGSRPFRAVAGAIRTALSSFARGDAFERWLERREREALASASCRRDVLPPTGFIDLTALLPFLSPTG